MAPQIAWFSSYPVRPARARRRPPHKASTSRNAHLDVACTSPDRSGVPVSLARRAVLGCGSSSAEPSVTTAPLTRPAGG